MGYPLFDGPPVASYPLGVDLGSVMVVPTGPNVIYCRSTGPQAAESPHLSGKMVTTLAAALNQCRSGLFDTIICLPGHSESVTTTPTFVAGVRIIGVGRGGNMPVFRWTATTSQWAISVADVTVSNLRLRLEGANGITKAIAVTGADVRFEGCDIEVASGATAKAVIGLEVGTGGARFELVKSRLRGTDTHNVTDGVLVAAAVDGVRIVGNEMIFSATAGNGNIRVGAVAATNMVIAGNLLANTHTASTANVAFGAAASTGILAYNAMSTINDGTVTAQGATFGAGCLVRSFQNFSCDEPVKSGTLTPTAGT